MVGKLNFEYIFKKQLIKFKTWKLKKTTFAFILSIFGSLLFSSLRYDICKFLVSWWLPIKVGKNYLSYSRRPFQANVLIIATSASRKKISSISCWKERMPFKMKTNSYEKLCLMDSLYGGTILNIIYSNYNLCYIRWRSLT